MFSFGLIWSVNPRGLLTIVKFFGYINGHIVSNLSQSSFVYRVINGSVVKSPHEYVWN